VQAAIAMTIVRLRLSEICTLAGQNLSLPRKRLSPLEEGKTLPVLSYNTKDFGGQAL
jgi:hypothetical protein